MDTEEAFMIKKQKIIIIISLALILVLALAYFLIIAPSLKTTFEYSFGATVGNEVYSDVNGNIFEIVEDEKGNKKWMIVSSTEFEVETDDEGNKYYNNFQTGEEYKISEDAEKAPTFTQLMFPPIEKENIDSITIHNDINEFGFFQGDDGSFYMTDHYGTPYNSDNFSYLVVACRYPAVYERMTTDMSRLADYGLDEESSPSWYEIKEQTGRSYKVYIGDLAPTGNRYYVRVEGQDAIYIADTDIDYMLRSANDYVLPILSMPSDQNEYYMTERFTLTVDGEKFVDIDFLSEEERAEEATASYYKMLYPKGYAVNSTNYDEILKTFVSFTGSQVMEFANVNDSLPNETLAKYSVDADSYKYHIYYEYGGIENDIFISDLQYETVVDEESGEEVSTGNTFYYAYSLHFNLIAKVTPDVLKFLTWDHLRYVDRPILSHVNINQVESIAIESETVSETFKLSGEDDALSVIPASRVTAFNADEVTNFRRYYVKLLSLSIEDYSSSHETDELIMTVTLTTRAGKVTEYKFYDTTAGHSYFTIDGEGEFYVLKEKVQRIIDDTLVLLDGGEINSETN